MRAVNGHEKSNLPLVNFLPVREATKILQNILFMTVL
jgi:hypothetical protein